MYQMKIAYLAAAHSIHTVRWVNEMARRGHKVHLITMHPPTVNNPVDSSVNIHVLPFRPPLGYFLNVWHLKWLLKDIQPQLLHTSYASGYGTLSRMSGYHPTLLSVWGSDVFLFPYESRLKEKILRKNLATADYIAATSSALKNQTEKFIKPKRPITVTPFGVDCSKFKPHKEFTTQKEFVVGTVKNLEPVYGIEYLIEAFAIVKAKYRGTKQLRLSIAGEGSLKKRLMNLAVKLGIGNSTNFLGFVPHVEVPKVLNQFSVFTCLSISESFGVAVLEASACGIPVIVSDTGGLPEVAKNNETGFIVPSRNPDAAAEAIIKLIEDEALRKRMGAEGRNFVLQNYEWKDCASRMEKLYEDIITMDVKGII